jgi:hypothetical protein
MPAIPPHYSQAVCGKVTTFSRQSEREVAERRPFGAKIAPCPS